MIIGVPKEIKNNEFRVGDDARPARASSSPRPHGARREGRGRRLVVHGRRVRRPRAPRSSTPPRRSSSAPR